MTPKTQTLLLSLLAAELDRLRLRNMGAARIYDEDFLVKGTWRGDLHRRVRARELLTVRRAICEVKAAE